MARLLVVDDEPAVRDALERALRLEGHEVSLAEDGDAALKAIGAEDPDAVILDILMPGLDGLQLARLIRAAGNDVPILMLTARDAVADRVEGLDAGADDYLVKPFALDELKARIRALLRRSLQEGDGALRYEDLELDPSSYRVRRGERPVKLTRTEFLLLELLLRNAEQVLTRDVIFDRVWGYDF
ncbi:MAG TPA: response regulator transcription factor, partial [Longimicrobiales bacterium]